jgi:hypothetical protein
MPLKLHITASIRRRAAPPARTQKWRSARSGPRHPSIASRSSSPDWDLQGGNIALSPNRHVTQRRNGQGPALNPCSEMPMPSQPGAATIETKRLTGCTGSTGARGERMSVSDRIGLGRANISCRAHARGAESTVLCAMGALVQRRRGWGWSPGEQMNGSPRPSGP